MTARPSWEEPLRTPHPCDHFVQLYKDETFLVRAVVHFLGAGLTHGEAAVVIATAAHRDLFIAGLAATGVDTRDVVDEGQLILLDAEDCLAEFMVDGMPDRAAFFTLIKGVLDRARGAGVGQIRLFGEMVDLLWDHNLEATVQLEAFWKSVVDEQGLSLLCAYRIDNFDHQAHRGLLHQISRSHSHLIPVEDDKGLDEAVDQAYADVFGVRGDAARLRALLTSGYSVTLQMPAAERALLALRDLSPGLADSVLERARHHYYRA